MKNLFNYFLRVALASAALFVVSAVVGFLAGLAWGGVKLGFSVFG